MDEGNDFIEGQSAGFAFYAESGNGDEVFFVGADQGSTTINDFGADGAVDRIDVSGLADVFADPDALMGRPRR